MPDRRPVPGAGVPVPDAVCWRQMPGAGAGCQVPDAGAGCRVPGAGCRCQWPLAAGAGGRVGCRVPVPGACPVAGCRKTKNVYYG